GNQDRRSMGRDAFINKVWEWKEESGGTILNQLKRLGASCDWENTKFTLDPEMNVAVNKVFVDLYNEGLIYRAKRLVNWDPHFQTAISNLEVENKEVDGHMWHFKYPLAGGETYTYVERDADGNVTLEEERDYISIATTRPETMLGDGAVAVHPSDERYAPIVGKLCEIPVGPKEHRRLIPIITDEYPDPDFGSGAVKITGAHDFNDYQVAKRGNIPMYALMDEKGFMRADGEDYATVAEVAQRIAEGKEDFDEAKIAAMNLVPDPYRGLDRFEARKAVVADITAEGNAVMIADPKWKPEAGAGDPGSSPGQSDADATSPAKPAPAQAGEPGSPATTPLIPLVENKKIMQPFGDRSGVVIEPMLTDQWFVDAETLAKPAIAAVREGQTKFVPENWDRTYYNWMENIEPWCISRQLWWGHRIPVWYGPAKDADGNWSSTQAFCANSEAEALREAEQAYAGSIRLTSLDEFKQKEGLDPESDEVLLYQDEDVLDTWFSSGLWPFSTQGWPEETDGLKAFYPGATLVTAFDIIFFWVARMMMLGIKFMDGEVPFKDVYIHAIVRDENGNKMSKSEGNVIDPVDLIDGIDADALVAKRTTGLRQPEKAPQVEKATRKRYPNGFEAYGADALRFTLAAMATKGRDINLSVDRVAGYRNFGSKLWSATRFAQMYEADFESRVNPSTLRLALNRWIVSELYKCCDAVSEAIEDYRFNDAADAAYQFVWSVFCDWYLELSKPILQGPEGEGKAEVRRVLSWTLERIFAVLHPFMPFITETLWEQTAARESFLMQQAWPGLSAEFSDPDATAEMDWVLSVISQMRSVRSDVNVPAGAKVPVSFIGANEITTQRIETHRDVIMRLARLATLEHADAAPAGGVKTIVGEATLVLEIADLIDAGEEVARLDKQLGKIGGEIAGLEKRLGNEAFVAKAPADIVTEQRQRLADLKGTHDKLSLARDQLAAL
ncbi:MAG: valine--tRNA ligase, partial [Pseudomonadota bacterium]